MRVLERWLVFIFCMIAIHTASAQVSACMQQLPSRYLENISSKSKKLDQLLGKRSENALQQNDEAGSQDEKEALNPPCL